MTAPTGRRYDLVLRVVSGPSASSTPTELRGPSVIVGSEPPPGGLRIPLGRGVAAQHATITAYDPDAAVLTPLGDNPVRLAPYAVERWDDLEPVRGRVRLERGNAIHLGPTGQRGVTLEFLGCRDLGDAEVERLASEASDVVLQGDRAPDSIAAVRQRPSVQTLLADGMASGALTRWAILLFGSSAALLALAIVLVVVGGSVPSEQPQDGGWRWVYLEDADLAADALTKHEGFHAALDAFVFGPDRELARKAGVVDVPGLAADDAGTWDPRLSAAIVKSTRAFARPWIFRRYEEIAPEFREVVERLSAAGRPVVLAGVPMLESCYNRAALSDVCAYGWWQFMPEFGARFRGQGAAYDVAECRFLDGRPGRFTPTAKAPPGFVKKNAVYYDEAGQRCALRSPCATDFRDDLDLSTDVAMLALGEPLDDPDVAASGAAVQIAIASHHAGWDDAALLGTATGKAWNLKRAYARWKAQPGRTVPTAHFYGDVLRCTGADQDESGCAHFMSPVTQTYAPAAVAEFLLAVCYYARNADDGFEWARPWARFVAPGGYCTDLPVPVPSRADVARVRFDPAVKWCRRS